MKITRFFIFCSLSLIFTFASAYSVDARAPKTEKIVFSSNRRGNWDIYVMNPDGKNQVRLTKSPLVDVSPVWSPTGEQILFVSYRDGIRDLYVMDADGRHLRRVFRNSARRSEPAWAPDGERIVFHAELPQWSIQTATIHGRDVRIVASADPRGGNPSWSPDGTEIAYVDDVGGSRRIRIVTLNSGEIRTFLPKASSWMYTPAWSPDGERLAFTWYKWGIGDKDALFIANRDGSRLKQIGKAVPGTSSPAWSPAGDKIVYMEEAREGDRQIAIIDINSKRKKELTHRGWNITPSWFDPAFVTLPVAPQPHLLTTVWGEIKAD
ncbi:MAG: hypothetical protein OXN25_05160 [Candidatus Poribacteria bacterium]|nr:hypothetical protein [Candidatus Poribacteria bacterium]